jgi:hypothetical protein
MNIFTRLGMWWDDKNVKKSKFDLYSKINSEAHGFYEKHLTRHDGFIDALQTKVELSQSALQVHWEKIKALENKEQIPPQIARDMAILKQQMDRMELYVGLKREPQATHVQGAPKIS